MTKIQLRNLISKVNIPKIFIRKKLLITVGLIIVCLFSYVSFMKLHDAAIARQDKKISNNVVQLSKKGDCKEGLRELDSNKKISEYSSATQIKVLDYQMQCNTIQGKYDEGLKAGESLRKIYEQEGKTQKKQYVEQYLSNIREIRKTLNAHN